RCDHGDAAAAEEAAHRGAEAPLPDRAPADVAEAAEEEAEERDRDVVAVIDGDADGDHEVGGHHQLDERRERLGRTVLLPRPALELAANAMLRRAHELGLPSHE